MKTRLDNHQPGTAPRSRRSAKVLEVIRVILSGQSYVSPQMSARLLDAVTGRRPRGSTSPIEKLSNREF